jgi:hypothetical protein
MQMSTRGGSSETLANELIVMPYGWPSVPIKVVIVTPVGKQLQTRRKLS